MKNAAFISFAIVIVAFMPIFASASAGMGFTLNTAEAKLCSCSTTQITGTLTSSGYGVYSLASGSKWVTIAPDTVTLGPDESTQVYIYLTTDCTSPPKDYPIEITARSDSGLSETRQITATVLPCHNINLDISPSAASACLEESAHFSVSVTNNGKADEDFIISASEGVLEKEKITLMRNETKTVGLDVPANDTQKDVIILVRSTSTYAADSKTIKVNGVNCHSAVFEISPTEQAACLGDSLNYSATLKNTGTRKDDFQINSTFGALSEHSVSLDAGNSKQITLSAQSDAPGNYTFFITALSRYVKAETSGVFTAKQCRGVDASIAPVEQTACKEYGANYSIRLKNTGILDDAYTITSNMGALETKKLEIPKGESKTISLSVPAGSLGGKNDITVMAISSGDTKVVSTADAILNTESCYRLNGTAKSIEEKICAGESATLAFDVQNTGTLEDVFEISSTLGNVSKKSITLSPEDRATISITVPTGFGQYGKRNLTLSIASKNTNLTQNFGIEIEPSETCYGFGLLAKKDTQFTNDSIGKLFEINIDNIGKGSNNFSARLEAPLWAYISPKEFLLQKGKNATIYVYAAPSYGTKDGAYLMKITVKNDAGLSKNEFVQLVLGNATPLDLSKLRGAPTGNAVKTTASQKSVYVIVLGIIVIAIIIFGPGLFGKKKETEEGEGVELKADFPEDLIGTDKTIILEPSEEKLSGAEEEKTEEKEASEDEMKGEKAEEKDAAKHGKKAQSKPKKPKSKSSKKDLQDILDNV